MGGCFWRPICSGSGSIHSAAALFATEFANGEFSKAEKKNTMANECLAEIVLIDPKGIKRGEFLWSVGGPFGRILNNLVSPVMSKERKVRYRSELERKVQVLQMEATTLSAQVTMVQRDYAGHATQNKEMKIRLQIFAKFLFKYCCCLVSLSKLQLKHMLTVLMCCLE